MVRYSHGGYTFEALSDVSRLGGTSKILNGFPSVPGFVSIRAYQEYEAHFRGALMTLFGEPARKSSISDEAFDYVIEARDDAGHICILSAYSGASGPAIGGRRPDEGCVVPAKALLELIEATTPADFEAVIYDDDTDNTVRYGIRNGLYYYEERRGQHLEE